MKERFYNFKFKMDADPASEPRMIVDLDEKHGLTYKMVDKDNHEIESILFEIEGFYEGDNKPHKVLNSQPIIDNRLVTNIDAEIARYDVLLVVDTSYEIINNVKVAFTPIMIYSRISIDEGKNEYERSSYLAEWDATKIDEPENYMYAFAIELLRDHYEEQSISPLTAVIIDSGLNNISSYNDKTKPIFNNYFLPDNFHIFYASSDRGNEFFQNKLLKLCDKEAKEALKEYKKNAGPHVI